MFGQINHKLGVMKTHRETLIDTAVADAELPPEFAKLIAESAPWLSGSDEVSEELGPELLSEEAKALGISRRKLLEFMERYNTLVQSFSNAHAPLQEAAYLAMEKTLKPYGRADAFGEGDYWLVSDSFSTGTPVIQVFDNFRFPMAALAELQKLINQYNGVFSELRINTEYGQELATLRPK